jgi:hypothetical protein
VIKSRTTRLQDQNKTMGTKQSRPQTTMNAVEVRGETNLKLEAQKIKDFTGGHEDWAKWKSRTLCAFSGSGYERVLEDKVYAAIKTSV